MWIAEFKVWHAGSMSIELSKSFKASLANVNLNLFKEKGKLHIVRCAYISGTDAEGFQRTWLQKDKRIKVIATDAAQVFYSHPADFAFHTLLFDRSVFFVGPNVTKGGFQYWKVASLQKKPLLSLYKRVNALGPTKATIELLSLKQGDFDVFSYGALSELTPLQLNALQLACRYGYYNYPRKANLEELAKIAKIPRTTLQSHLRRAERTLIPLLMGNLQ